MANKNINGDVNVSFTEAASRQSLESGESVKTLFGKLRKWLSDLKPVAFSGSYNDLTDKTMSGYTKPASTSAITASDTINEAIGKLEKGLDGAGTPNDGVLTIQQNGTTIGTFSANQLEDTIIDIKTEEETVILGLRVDFENNTFTRLGDAIGLSGGEDFDRFPMYKRRRCNLDEFGRVTAYLGDDNYAEDGTNGSVYVEQPAFYYQIKKYDYYSSCYKTIEYWISNKPLSGFVLYPAFYNNRPFIYESAYEGYYEGTTLKSIAGVNPTIFTSISSAPISRGETLELLGARKILMIIEYGQMNLQEAIGYGNVNGAAMLKTGTLSHIGNGTYGTTQDTTTAVQWRGIENPWGNSSTIIRNIRANMATSTTGKITYTPISGASSSSFTFDSSINTSNNLKYGYIRYFRNGWESYFMPYLLTGDSSLPVGDYASLSAQSSSSSVSTSDIPFIYGGANNFSSQAGPFYLCFSYSYLTSIKANIRISA